MEPLFPFAGDNSILAEACSNLKRQFLHGNGSA